MSCELAPHHLFFSIKDITLFEPEMKKVKKYLFKNDQKCSVGVQRSDLVLCCVNATFILRLIVYDEPIEDWRVHQI